MNLGKIFNRHTKEKEVPKEVISPPAMERPDCYDGDASWGERDYPGEKCAGCKYWNIINPSGENAGWCYKGY